MSKLFNFNDIPVHEVQHGYVLVIHLNGSPVLFRVNAVGGSSKRQDDGSYRNTRILESEPRPDTGQPMKVEYATGEQVKRMEPMHPADVAAPWPTEEVVPSALRVGDVVKFPEADRWLQITQRHDVPDTSPAWEHALGKRFFLLAPTEGNFGHLAIAYDHLEDNSTVLRRAAS